MKPENRAAKAKLKNAGGKNAVDLDNPWWMILRWLPSGRDSESIRFRTKAKSVHHEDTKDTKFSIDWVCWFPSRSSLRYTQVSECHRHPGRDCRDPEATDGNAQVSSTSCNAGISYWRTFTSLCSGFRQSLHDYMAPAWEPYIGGKYEIRKISGSLGNRSKSGCCEIWRR